jgi:hypothetical protein
MGSAHAIGSCGGGGVRRLATLEEGATIYQRAGECGLKVRMEVTDFQDQVRIITECCPQGEDCCEG